MSTDATSPDQTAGSRPRRRRDVAVWLAALLWALLMSPLLPWGLPSSAEDDLLFGGGPAWKAERYDLNRVLDQRRARDAGADTDVNPLGARDRLVLLTTDEAARAEILRRYRLFSRQPDEMITFMALQRMRPHQGDFDPKLYQYGGGYIYLIGAALGASSLCGLTQLTSQVGTYLEQPELFARFYLVARVVSVVFGGVLLVGTWKLGKRAGGWVAAWLSMLFLAGTPVFITGVLEAKPHVPAACMAVWAVLSALDYCARGKVRDVVCLGLQAGYAMGLVLTGVVALAVWPALLLSRRPWLARGLIGAALAMGAFLLTNPYIAYNSVFDRASLRSNVSNSTAMYTHQMERAGEGALRVGVLLNESCGPTLIPAGAIGLILLLRWRPRETLIGAAPGLATLLIAVLLGAGKPAEYARFLILPVGLLCVCAGYLVSRLSRPTRRGAVLAAAIVVIPMGTIPYVLSFAADVSLTGESRYRAARYLQTQLGPADTVGVLQEPAPYAVPPLDFERREIYWLPPTVPPDLTPSRLPQWLVFTADDRHVHARAWWTGHYQLAARFPFAGTPLSPIAWANKPTFVYRRAEETRLVPSGP